MARQTSRSANTQDARSIVDEIIGDAVLARASDIHIEPQENELVIRLRVDGLLKVRKRLPMEVHSALVSRIKILAGLDITERRVPQDGRFRFERNNRAVDLRVATSPMVDGEKIVMRAINAKLSKLKIEDLGYSERNLKIYRRLISIPHGLVMHCGPTGSGKTTSLYTALNFLNEESRNIQTVEDPVEVRMTGLNQAQVNPDHGVTFAAILRSYLRQDCDVVLVGEIRDNETANLATQAALTGHLILGTLHCNSAVGAVSRLSDMDVGPFFVGTALSGVVYQRLVRRLCTHCREAYFPIDKIAKALSLDTNTQIYRAKGCRQCMNLGYRGRLLVQEVLFVDDEVREAIFGEMPAYQLEELAQKQGMIPIFEDGLMKARLGVTSVEEVARVIKGANLGK